MKELSVNFGDSVVTSCTWTLQVVRARREMHGCMVLPLGRDHGAPDSFVSWGLHGPEFCMGNKFRGS
eukprot:symbB.v1.2.041486.t1/scaffold8268.1/size7007/1